jgi:hypothetical protein
MERYMEALVLASETKPDKHKESEWVRSRFFHIKKSGGQAVYFDSVSGDQCLQYQHIVSQLIGRGNNWEAANEIAENTHYQPIILSPVYRPNKGRVVGLHGNLYPNLWRRPSVQPANVSSKPFTDHLVKMLGSKAKADYLVKMLAYRYQTHEVKAKPHVCFYFYGLVGGYGKSLFASTVEKVFGKTATMSVMDQTALDSMSAIDMWTRTWVIVQEVDVKKGSTNYNKIKTMTGGDSFAAARKGEHFKDYETPAQLMMLSNDPPHFLEPNDRRFFVSQWQCEFDTPTDKDRYFNDYVDWLEHQGGYSAIANLLNTTNITKVDVAAPAMMTQEKEQVISMGADECVSACLDIIEENPNQLLFTTSDFMRTFAEHGVDSKAEKYKLEAAGLTKQKAIKIDGVRHYFWTPQGCRVVSQKGVEACVVTTDGKSKPVREALRTLEDGL